MTQYHIMGSLRFDLGMSDGVFKMISVVISANVAGLLINLEDPLLWRCLKKGRRRRLNGKL